MVEADVYIRYGSGRIDRHSGKVSSALAGINQVWRGRAAQVAANGFYSALQGGLEAAINAAFRNVYIWQNDRLPEGNGGVRNYAHASPQNPLYDPRVDFRDYAVSLAGNNSITDCNKLALLIYKAGQVFGGDNPFYFENRDAIVHGLMSGLTEFTRVTLGGRQGPSNPDYRAGVFQRDRHFAGGFHDSGFDGRFQDGGNQVRHFIFYFAAGYGIGETAANAGLYDAEGTRSGRNADIALGWEGTKRGAIFQGDYKQLAQDVWRHVCGQSSPLNLP